MASRALVVPLGVLAAVLVVAGGTATIAARSGNDAASPVPASSPAAPRGVSELQAAARATLGHPGLLGQSEPSPGAGSTLRVEMDTRTGDVRQTARFVLPGLPSAETEARTVNGRTYTRVPSGTFDRGAVSMTGPGSDTSRPWLTTSQAEPGPETNMLAVLRLLADADPSVTLVRQERRGEVTGYTVRTPRNPLGLGSEYDVDVRSGEIVRIASRSQLPDCPGLDEARIRRFEAPAQPAVLIRPAERPVVVAAPPSEQVETVASPDPGESSASERSDDLCTEIGELPSAVPTDPPLDPTLPAFPPLPEPPPPSSPPGG